MPGAGRHPLSAQEVARLTGGRLIGPGTPVVERVAPIDRAGRGDLTFVGGRAYLDAFARAAGAVALVEPAFAEAPSAVAARVVVPDAHVALLAVLPVLYPEPPGPAGVDPTAVIGAGARWEEPVALGPHVVIGAGARLGRGVRIDAGCVVGAGVEIGDQVHLYPNVTVYPGTVLGHRVVVHAGTVLGSDGFGYVPRPGALPLKIPQVGRCVIGDDVELGANVTVDRGSVDDTVIGRGTKIDNLVQVAHNVHIGERCLVAAMVGIAGSTRVGDDVFLAGQVGLADHIRVGHRVKATVQSGLIGDVPDDAVVTGYPARSHREFLRAQAALYRLAPLVHDLEALVRKAP